ncbi:MAG TPA: helix-turn-helix transcriptional regulator [Verrucomicrobiae bacterium]|jgi:DNA-binding XRE family transcriptional regulator|nr:helix-turn-helix transcriptional regulator [Verrucomicrobiae bacterium]
MSQEKLLTEKELATLAKKFREAAGRSRAEAGRELDVSHVSIHRAEENPEESLFKLRTRMIEKYSPFKVIGPVFYLQQK